MELHFCERWKTRFSHSETILETGNKFSGYTFFLSLAAKSIKASDESSEAPILRRVSISEIAQTSRLLLHISSPRDRMADFVFPETRETISRDLRSQSENKSASGEQSDIRRRKNAAENAAAKINSAQTRRKTFLHRKATSDSDNHPSALFSSISEALSAKIYSLKLLPPSTPRALRPSAALTSMERAISGSGENSPQGLGSTVLHGLSHANCDSFLPNTWVADAKEVRPTPGHRK